ncbi:cytochrome c oxidase subunit II [Haloarchaeobius sp. HRN-SO-5]|uniref:cytochrome c oxidase subunit II n=1 Tax=Haloarchaeobius sp. HRN-SO-5 TaxID=3446118 RepID=UPI003EC04D7D
MNVGLLLQAAGGGIDGIVPRGTRAEIFQRIFDVFLVLGTVVGLFVVGYMLYNAYRYRADGPRDVTGYDDERPELGELPTGGGHGRKLLLSFTISAIIVVSLILWTYGSLAFVEAGGNPQANPEVEDTMTVNVTGYQFGWRFEYPNGATTDGTMYVPEDTQVRIRVTSDDVFHNFGIPAFKTKTDAIPGQTTTTWFGPAEAGNYTAKCYELCGAGHSYMTADIVVMEDSEFESWYDNSTDSSGTNASNRTIAA